MVQVLVLAGSDDDDIIVDMMGIHRYMQDKHTSYAKYMTVSNIPRQQFHHGPPTNRKLVFDPYNDGKFWVEIQEDDFLTEASAEVASLTKRSTEKIVLIILTHGAPDGTIKMGSNSIHIASFLKSLEWFPNVRVTVLSMACYSGLPQWSNSISAITPLGNATFSHTAATGISWPFKRSNSDKPGGSIFITNVIKTANPDSKVSVHTVETTRLVMYDAIARGAGGQNTHSFTVPSAVLEETLDGFFPEITMSGMWDADMKPPQPEPWITSTTTCKLVLLIRLIVGLKSKTQDVFRYLRYHGWEVKPRNVTADTMGFSMTKARFMHTENDTDPDPFIKKLFTIAKRQGCTLEEQESFIEAIQWKELMDILTYQRLSQLQKLKRPLRRRWSEKRITIRNFSWILHEVMESCGSGTIYSRILTLIIQEIFAMIASALYEHERQIKDSFPGKNVLVGTIPYSRALSFMTACLVINSWNVNDIKTAYALMCVVSEENVSPLTKNSTKFD